MDIRYPLLYVSLILLAIFTLLAFVPPVQGFITRYWVQGDISKIVRFKNMVIRIGVVGILLSTFTLIYVVISLLL